MLIAGHEVVIGLETHVQLRTRSKLFSGAATAFGAAANTQACAVDVALPGTLPVLNREAVRCAILLGLALDAQIARHSVFARKNYFYPDLPKGYQISQFDDPIVQGGRLTYWDPVAHREKALRLVRAHLEEDAGKSLHDAIPGATGIDFNRAGMPLLEIVSTPELRSADEAVAYARALHQLVCWIGICDGNLQEGAFRCDANVSVRKPGTPLGTRREIKNLNSFRFLRQAIDYEARWQIAQLENGAAIRQATVLFDPATGTTRSMRSKEDSADYRYFPDPDLPPLTVSPEWVQQLRAHLPELPAQVLQRFMNRYQLPETEARALTQSRAMAAYFEQLVRTGATPRLAGNWIRGPLASRLNRAQLEIAQAPVPAATLARLLIHIQDGTLSDSAARTIFDRLWEKSGTLDALIAAHEKTTSSEDTALRALIQRVIAANAESVAQFQGGKDKALHALIGQVLKASRGTADPAHVNALLREQLRRPDSSATT